MAKRGHKRFWRFGCFTALLLGGAVFVWLFTSTRQIPTTGVITQRTILALHGPLDPNDEGVKAVWKALTDRWQGENALLGRVLGWLGIPRELTIVLYDTQPSPLGVVAINFRKGFRWLWLPLRIFGKHFKGAHYIVSHHFVAGMMGGTIIVAEDEVTLCYAIDNIMRAGESEKPNLRFTRKLRDRYDLVGFVSPQILSSNEHIQLPANLGEIGLDIVDTKELRGSVFWICQSEREAEAMTRALEQAEKEISADFSRKGVQCSFRKQREEMFVWWEFRLTNFTALFR